MFEQRAEHHIRGHGCPKCACAGVSKISIEWLRLMKIVHDCTDLIMGDVDSEYKIEGIGRVDGFSKLRNTVYEFHGDYWHGNPKRFDPSEVFHDVITFGDLYAKTLARDRSIQECGFELFVMWESEWKLRKRLCKQICEHYVCEERGS